MVGALANGFSQIGDPNTIAYLDEKQYWPFWSVCDELDVPFYLHPRNPLPQDSRIYKGHDWLMGPMQEHRNVYAPDVFIFGQEAGPSDISGRNNPRQTGFFDKLKDAWNDLTE